MVEIRQIHRLSSGADLQCKCSRQQPVKVCLASLLFYCFPYNFLIQLSLVGFQGALRFNNLRLPLTPIFQIVVRLTINILNNHQTVNYLFYNHTLMLSSPTLPRFVRRVNVQYSFDLPYKLHSFSVDTQPILFITENFMNSLNLHA